MASKTKSNIVVSIVGPSNSGKSTFLNSTLGEKVSIVSRKVQTTRMGLRGILNNKNVQIIFIDTPGLFEAKTRFEKAMVENAFFNLSNADLVYFVIDGSRKLKNFEIKVLKYFKNFNKDSFLVINKIDLMNKERLLIKSKEINFTLTNKQNHSDFLLCSFSCSVKKGRNIFLFLLEKNQS